jgi:(1->4)-alpha-D-glucan 1-alpha-D-glucosylmutase
VEPDESHERRLLEAIAAVYEELPPGFEAFAARVAEAGRRSSLAMTLLKLTVPGLPDLYQGDELESLSLVDPDNRRPVDFALRRRLLGSADEPPKLRLVREALELRARCWLGAYEPLPVSPEVCAFRRGEDVVAAAVVRGPRARLRLPPGAWRDVPTKTEHERELDLRDVALLERV